MSDNRGTEQGRDPARPILEDDELPGDVYDNEDEILDDTDDLVVEQDSNDLEDFDEIRRG